MCTAFSIMLHTSYQQYEQIFPRALGQSQNIGKDPVHLISTANDVSSRDKSLHDSGWASRTRLNIVGAIRLGYLSEAVIEQYHKTVNGESIVDFLTKTRQLYHTSGTIHLVLDGAGYHRSALVVDAAKELNITLHYLPLYSPNLKPIGRLWKVMNKYARNSQYFATTKEFRERIDRFFITTLPEIDLQSRQYN